MRQAIASSVFVLGALACGTLLSTSPDAFPTGDDAAIDAGTGIADAAPINDASVEPLVDAAVDPPCRVPKTDGFEALNWVTDNLWQPPMPTGGGSFTIVGPPKTRTAMGAFEAQSPSPGDEAWIRTAVSGSCPLTIDLWAQRVEGDSDVTILRINADARALSLVFGETAFGVVSAPGSVNQGLGDFANGVYRHIIVTYVPAGTVVVTIDSTPPLTWSLNDDAGTSAAKTVELGIVNRSGLGVATRVLFDDVSIY